MEYTFATKWNKVIYITNDPTLENIDIPIGCCKYPTLWVKEATELLTPIRLVTVRKVIGIVAFELEVLKAKICTSRIFAKKVLTDSPEVSLSITIIVTKK